jgi:hypothetical protein
VIDSPKSNCNSLISPRTGVATTPASSISQTTFWGRAASTPFPLENSEGFLHLWAFRVHRGATSTSINMASLPPPDQYRALVKRLSSSGYLLNKQLQHICQVNGLRTSGVKAELQRRILDGEFVPPSSF